MNVRPVIHRELRVAARRRETWRLRLAFAGAALLAFLFGRLLPHVSLNDRGQVVLTCLTVAAFALSLGAGPYLTADAISSEKRDGTLGLLFLTPLNAWQIVMGKLATHALQVGYGWLAGFPVFFLPMLLGGVTWGEVVRVLLALLATMGLSLTAGLLWSTVCTEARTAVMATIGSLLLLVFLPLLWPFLEILFASRNPTFSGLPQFSPLTALIFGFESNYRLTATRGPMNGAGVFWAAWITNGIVSFLLLAIAGWKLSRVWRQAETSAPPTNRTCPEEETDRPAAHVRRLQGGKFPGTGPLAWLAARGLQEGIWPKLLRGIGGLFFAVMLLASVTTRGEEECFIAAFCTAYGLHFVTRIQWALAATRRWHEDRRSGALEMLLATPVTDAELLAAHHAAVKRAFRRSLGVLLGLNLALQLTVFLGYRKLHMSGGAWAVFTVFFTGGALITLADAAAIRWLAFREALTCATQLKATGRTLAWLMVAPGLAFAGAWLVALGFREEKAITGIFGGWVLFCLAYNRVLIERGRRWIDGGLRRRLSESEG